MFNLKDKLLAKGLVTKEQAEKVSSPKKHFKQKNSHSSNTSLTDAGSYADWDRENSLKKLLNQTKNDQYNTIRKWVDVNRLDNEKECSLDAEKYFIPSEGDQISWLSLKKDVIEKINNGKAGIIAYMSNHGLKHAVVQRDIAEDVAKIFPSWLKVLNDQN